MEKEDRAAPAAAAPSSGNLAALAQLDLRDCPQASAMRDRVLAKCQGRRRGKGKLAPGLQQRLARAVERGAMDEDEAAAIIDRWAAPHRRQIELCAKAERHDAQFEAAQPDDEDPDDEAAA